MPDIGEHVGNYCLVETLASGAFGQVYRAEHTLLKQRQVAIKFLRLERLDNAEERNTFLQEAHFLDQLKHPALLPIIDVGLHDEIPYIITEYAPNGTLRAYLQRQATQPVALTEALRIIVPVSEALQYAHEHNIVHRDLKPENILFNAQNEALLADFGIAVLLDAGTTFLGDISGTTPYMAPEQFDGTISPKCDQYALGCIIYELLTGKRPFTAKRSSMAAMWYQHAKVLPVPPRQLNPMLPEYVEAALLQALAKERNERHTNVAAFLEALRPESQTPHIHLPLAEPSKASETPTRSLQPLSKMHTSMHSIPDSTIVLDLLTVSENRSNMHTSTTKSEQTNSFKETPTPLPISPAFEPISSVPSTLTQAVIAWYKRPLTIVSSIVLICILIAGGIWSLIPVHNLQNLSPSQLTATIVITPASRLEQNNYIITAIPDGSIDNVLRQVPARIVTVTSPIQTSTGNATGSVPAKTASGTLEFINAGSSTITLGSAVLTDKNGVQIKFNGPVAVPPANSTARVNAFAVNPGSAGNISVRDINQACCASGITAKNPLAFTGGLDAIPNSIIQQSDIDRAANPLATALTQSTQASLQQSIKTNERVVDGTAGCTPTVSADQQAGNVAKQVHVSVTVTCHEEVYDAVIAQQMAVSLLLAQAQSDPVLNAQYAQVGLTIANVLNASIVDSNGKVNLEVHVQGLWVYQFTPQSQQNLKLKLVKLSQPSAQATLQHWPGVATAKINLSSGTTMPADANAITLTVQNIPSVQGTPSGTNNGTPTNSTIPSPTVSLGGS